VNSRLAGRLQTLAGAAVLISVVTLVSRVLGFARWMAQASWVGTGGIAQPYAVANLLPNILFEVVAGGALAGAVIPLLVGALHRGDEAGLRRAASALMTWALIVLIPLAALLTIFAPQVISLTSELHSAELNAKAVFFLRVFAVQIPLYGVGVVSGGILQAHKRFLWPALAPLFSSLVVIVTYCLFGILADGNQANVAALTADSIEVLAWGTTAGVAAMVLTMAGPVARLRLRLRPTLTFPKGMGRRALSLAFAGIGALLAQQLTMLLVVKVSGPGLFGTPETFNLFQYAQAIYVLPYAVLVVPLATSMFPRISALATQRDYAGFAAMSSNMTRIVILISALGAALLVAASGPLEDFFSAFTAGSVDGMAGAVAWAAPGLVGYSLILLCSRILYARDKGREAVIATAAGWLVAAAGTALPFVPFIHVAPADILALVSGAQAVGMTVAGVLLILALWHTGGRDCVSGVARTAVVALSAAILASGVGFGVAHVLPSAHSRLVVAVGNGIIAALAATAVAVTVVFLLDRATFMQLRNLRVGR